MLSLGQIKASLPALEVYLATPELIIRHLSIDTRSIIFPGATLFFSLSGSRKDGHIYVQEAYANGCRSFVVNPNFDRSAYNDANFLISSNIIHTLQQIAALHRQHFDLPVIGITGSNGKTWIKEWLFETLNGSHQIVRSPGSYNSQIGVALSVWNIDAHHNLGIIEAGISTTNEMASIAKLIRPSIGIFTGLGDAHQEGFKNLEEKLQEKILLFDSCHIIIYDQDDPMVATTMSTKFPTKQLATISRKNSDAIFYIKSIISKFEETEIEYIFQNETHTYKIPFNDSISITNSTIVALTNLLLGTSPQTLAEKMEALAPMNMRLQIVDAIQDSTLINDAYSLDLNSLKWALRKLEVVGQQQKKMLIISDIFQHGEDAYRQISDLISAYRIDHLIGIGKEIQSVQNYLPKDLEQRFFEDTDAFLKAIGQISFDHKTILLKGARLFKFEKIAIALTEKSHTVSLHIDFDAMLHNLQFFGRRIPNGTKVMAVIKASAYGSGSVEIARFLSFFKIDYVAVAVIDEGITLRKAGIKLPILVLNPNASSFQELYEWSLEPEVYSLSVLRQCLSAAKSLQRSVPVHLKINSGMNRLGFDPENLAELLAILTKNRDLIDIKSIFTHLTSSNNPEMDVFTEKQILAFDEIYQKLCHELQIKPWRHVLNSNGILRFPQYSYEMVRFGIGLYGIGMGAYNSFLKPVHSMRARVIQLRKIDQGDIVGYNNTFEAVAPMLIATVNIGYADGIPRNIGNGKYACFIQGQAATIVGRVCMDMLMCDVTNIAGVYEGMDVWIFDAQHSVEAMSQAADTIPYEILAKISPRVKRVFQYA